MESELERIGLTKNESKVYLALLELGLSSAKPIIEKVNMHRQQVYDALDSLMEKGLVSYVVQANRKHFRAEDPGEFLQYFNSRKEEIERQEKEFRQMLPRLEAAREEGKEEHEATIFKGYKGIKSLLDDMLKEKGEILTIGASDTKAESFQYNLKFNLPIFHKVREEKKIHYRILFSEEMKGRAKELGGLRYTQVRTLPKAFTSNSSTNIYGNNTSIIIWGKEPFGILIRSKDIAEAQRKHFEMLWKIGK